MAFASIVVAVDGCDASAEALRQAVALARRDGVALAGVFVVDDQWADFIGNDWQSSRNARQGFLDHVRQEQEQQARLARAQFEQAADGLPAASFHVLAGDPARTLLARAQAVDGLLVLGRRVFQVSGRPSLKSLARRLAEASPGAVLVLP